MLAKMINKHPPFGGGFPPNSLVGAENVLLEKCFCDYQTITKTDNLLKISPYLTMFFFTSYSSQQKNELTHSNSRFLKYIHRGVTKQGTVYIAGTTYDTEACLSVVVCLTPEGGSSWWTFTCLGIRNAWACWIAKARIRNPRVIVVLR